MKDDQILVSVMMITYNHSAYIQKSILSVLDQSGPFRLEVIVSNDCSTDRTSCIINKIIESHPKSHLIRFFDQKKNLGMQENFIYALKQCQGEFIAYCEGDDYWTDNRKIARQLDALSNFPTSILCFHAVEVLNENIVEKFKFPIPPSNRLVFKDLLTNHYVPTCSILFRNVFLKESVPTWLKKCFVLDIPLELYLATKGSFIYLEEEMACYRRNPGGVTQSKSHQSKAIDGYTYMYSLLARNLGRSNYILLKLKSIKYIYWKLRKFINRH